MWRRTMCRPSCPRPSPTAWCPWAMPGAAWSSMCARLGTQRRCPEPMALMDSVPSPLLPPTDTAPLLPPADKAHLPPQAARAPTPGHRALDRLNQLASVRRRFQRWWQERLPFCDSLLLTQRNVYILPTGAGWMLALTLLVLLIASINFQLNLGYLLTFLLAGSAVVGMHVCHANLRGITLQLQAPE